MTNHVDKQYKGLIDRISADGVDKVDRTGVGSRSVFGAQMRFDISDGKLPLLTTKKVHTRMIIHELLWMLSGDTNVRYLKENNVNIWDSWVDPETAVYRDLTIDEIQTAVAKERGVGRVVLDHTVTTEELGRLSNDGDVSVFCGLDLTTDPWQSVYRKVFEKEPRTLVAGELPKIYQHQWRHWEDTRMVTFDEAELKEPEGYEVVGEGALFENGHGIDGERAVIHREIDQITNAIEQLKANPDSRRILVSAWNAAEIDEMALPPCFNENMLVATPHGYKEISTITEGDIVLSGTGVPSKVNTVWKTPYEGEMVRLYVRTLKSCPIECTPNHPFLVHGKGWVNAENLDEGDYLAIPKSKSGNDHTFQYTKRHCSPHGRCQDLEKEHSCTPDDYYTFGYFLGNGWLLEKSSKIHFSIPNHKLSVVLPKIRKTLKVAPKKMKSSSCSTFEIASKKWHDTFSEFGHLAHNKRIPQWIMESTMESKLEFLKGFNDADGCDSEKGAINVTTTSPHIAFTLQRLYCEFGVRVSVGYQKRPATTIIEGRTVNQRGTYLVRGKLGISKNPLKTFFDKDHMWVKLGKKERYRSKEDVYNLDVEGEHTYTVNNIVNHNCHTLFQFWTRELSFEERTVMAKEKGFLIGEDPQGGTDNATLVLDTLEVPRRALSCQLYQR